MKNGEITIHTDGGSRGNPGPAACAFVAERDEKEIYKANKFLGKATNNFAEYHGVILAMDWLLENVTSQTKINFYLDSELIVRQLNGVYKIKDGVLKKLSSEIFEKIKKYSGEIIFLNVRREQNGTADFLVNECLDLNT